MILPLISDLGAVVGIERVLEEKRQQTLHHKGRVFGSHFSKVSLQCQKITGGLFKGDFLTCFTRLNLTTCDRSSCPRKCLSKLPPPFLLFEGIFYYIKNTRCNSFTCMDCLECKKNLVRFRGPKKLFQRFRGMD